MARRELTEEELLDKFDIGLSERKMKEDVVDFLIERLEGGHLHITDTIVMAIQMSKMQHVTLCMLHHTLVRSGNKDQLDAAHADGKDMGLVIDDLIEGLFSVEEGGE